MNANTAIIEVMLPILLGFVMQRAKVFGAREEEVLRDFVVKFSVPLMIFYSMYTSNLSQLPQMMTMVVALFLMTVLMAVLALIGTRWLPLSVAKKRAVVLAIAFGNYGWIGWAVVESFLGTAGLTQAIFFTLFWWPIFYLVGAFVGTDGNLKSLDRGMLRKISLGTLPTLVAVLVGLGVNLAPWSLPGPVEKTVADFSGMTVPLILFSVGLQMRLDRLGALYKLGIGISLARSLLGAIVGWIVAVVLNLNELSAAVVRIEGLCRWRPLFLS